MENLEPGPISVLDQKHTLPDLYSATESPNGELGFFLVSDGSSNPWRVRVRPPSFINYAIFSKLIDGVMLADVVVILASMNVTAGELDR